MINGREPVVVQTALVTAVAAVLNVLVLLGVFDLDQTAQTAIVTAVTTLAGLAIVLSVRPKVTPVAGPTLTVEQLKDVTVTSEAGTPLAVKPVLEATDRVDGPDHRA